ncbi:MAG TPA: nitrilase-related carbon-nitrogen hydrolase [Thermodesulfobacteriota bacterium]|nr:nitrilase-related carbon-nitrogen hydrolase [Thermodesulfobacteriota bacterium]
MNIVRAAVIQDSPVVFDRKATLEKVHSLVDRASKEGAKLVVIPEAFVSAYPIGLDFGARIGLRTPEGREDFRRYFESAVDVPGPACDALGKAARDAHVFLVIGVIERDGGTLYCTVLFFSPDGGFMGKHRKLMPTAMERLVWGFGDGSTMPVFHTPLGRIGSVICWENYMPMLRMHMYAQGIQLYCAPTADSRDSWLSSMRHIALEGRCFVLSCCQYLTRADCPKDYDAIQGDNPATVLMRGGSCVIGPLGQILAGPNFEGPTILTADLDLDEIPKGKYDFDVVGHYARPDIFRLYVNTRPTVPVVLSSEEGQNSDPFAR